MNTLAPVSSIMSTDLITVNPKDPLINVKNIFDQNNIHHIPVVRFKKIVGIVSKTDLMYFLKGLEKDRFDKIVNYTRLQSYLVEDIMTTGLAKLEPTEKILVALKVFKENLFHAIPIVEQDELVGIVTTYDIIKSLEEEAIGVK